MNRMIGSMVLFLVAGLALADEPPALPLPRVEADPTALILFAVFFVGMIGGFAIYLWMKERKK